MEIGNQIKYFRKQAKISQSDLGKVIEPTIKHPQDLIMRFELNRQEPKIRQLVRIAQALRIEINDLLNGHHKIESLATLVPDKRRWEIEHPRQIEALRLSQQHRHLVKILYECPHDHPRKHDHHFDYHRPFEVIRLCPSCHKAEHRRLRELKKQAQEQ